MRLAIAAFLFVSWFPLCSVGYAQQPATQPAMPEANPDIQAALRAMTVGGGQSTADHLTALGRLIDMKQRGRSSNDQWLKQSYIFLMQLQVENREAAWPAGNFLARYWQTFLQVPPEDFLTALAPYVEGEGSPGYTLIGVSGALGLTASGRGVGFPHIEQYLRSVGRNDPSWWVLEVMYGAHADAALNTAATVYLDRDPLQKVQRSQKELAILLLSWDLSGAERPDVAGRLLAKLEELTHHPHWCVRAYAVQIMRDVPWIEHATLAGSMDKDEHPLVSNMVKRLLASGKRR